MQTEYKLHFFIWTSGLFLLKI